MSSKESDLIGQLLIQKGLITVEVLERALAQQEHSQEHIGDILIRLGLINEDDFYTILSQQSGVEYVKIKDIKIDPLIIENIPAKFACHYELIPIEITDNMITVAMSNPLDIHTIDDIKLLNSNKILLKNNIKEHSKKFQKYFPKEYFANFLYPILQKQAKGFQKKYMFEHPEHQI